MGPVGPSLGHVCWPCLMRPVLDLQFGHVCWEPTSLMGLPIKFSAVCWQPAGFTSGAVSWQPTQVSRVHVGAVWGLMLATYRSYGACWAKFGLYVGNLQSYGACWTEFGAVCWQPTGLMGPVGLSLGLYVENLQVLSSLIWPSLGLYVGNLQRSP